MRALVVSDIHGNLEAFHAVLEDARAQGGYDEVWCLGDIVGYGPDPGPCLGLLRSMPHVAVAGNHDLAAIGKLDLELFNATAARAARWTAAQLTPQQVIYLDALPLVVERGEFTLVHGSLRNPALDYFLPVTMPEAALKESLARLKTSFCLLGHSHIPFVCVAEDLSFRRLPEGQEVRLPGERLTLNPGSVGQPRDGDPRASYLVYDGERAAILHLRLEYDIAATQAKMRRIGLPESLATRLSFGQ